MTEFVIHKNGQNVKNYKRMCSLIVIFITLIISVLLLVLHPAFIDSQKFAIYHFHERPIYFKFLTYLLTSIWFPILAYIQCCTLCCFLYTICMMHILHYKLLDYIDNNLCKSYEGMAVVDFESEQNAVSTHLKKCAIFHLHLRR